MVLPSPCVRRREQADLARCDRYDRNVAVDTNLSLAQLARDAEGLDTYRCAIAFITEVAELDADGVRMAIAREPVETGDPHLDAILGALAEHFAFHRDIDVPGWCQAPSRFLDTGWFPVDLASVRVRAFVTSPAAFARRLIFIDRSDLARV